MSVAESLRAERSPRRFTRRQVVGAAITLVGGGLLTVCSSPEQYTAPPKLPTLPPIPTETSQPPTIIPAPTVEVKPATPVPTRGPVPALDIPDSVEKGVSELTDIRVVNRAPEGSNPKPLDATYKEARILALRRAVFLQPWSVGRMLYKDVKAINDSEIQIGDRTYDLLDPTQLAKSAAIEERYIRGLRANDAFYNKSQPFDVRDAIGYIESLQGTGFKLEQSPYPLVESDALSRLGAAAGLLKGAGKFVPENWRTQHFTFREGFYDKGAGVVDFGFQEPLTALSAVYLSTEPDLVARYEEKAKAAEAGGRIKDPDLKLMDEVFYEEHILHPHVPYAEFRTMLMNVIWSREQVEGRVLWLESQGLDVESKGMRAKMDVITDWLGVKTSRKAHVLEDYNLKPGDKADIFDPDPFPLRGVVLREAPNGDFKRGNPSVFGHDEVTILAGSGLRVDSGNRYAAKMVEIQKEYDGRESGYIPQMYLVKPPAPRG